MERSDRRNYLAGAWWSARIALVLTSALAGSMYLLIVVWPDRPLLMALVFALVLFAGMAWLAALLLVIRALFARRMKLQIFWRSWVA